MELKRLQHFVALAEEGRFSLAARRVHLSQAAFSRSVQALEEQLGLRLFDRGHDGAHLTPAGETVLARARNLLFESGSLQRDIALIKSGDIGEITIGAAPIPASVILPELLSRLKRLRPDLLVRIRTGNLSTLLSQLDAQEIDFCMGDPRLLSGGQRYVMESLGNHSGSFYCRAGHPLARKVPVECNAIKEYGLATIALTPTVHSLLARSLGFDVEGLPLAVECDDVNMLTYMVAHSDAVGLLPDTIIGQSRQRLRRLPVACAIDGLEAHVNAIWLKGRTLAPAMTYAIQLARAVSEELVRTSPLSNAHGAV